MNLDLTKILRGSPESLFLWGESSEPSDLDTITKRSHDLREAILQFLVDIASSNLKVSTSKPHLTVESVFANFPQSYLRDLVLSSMQAICPFQNNPHNWPTPPDKGRVRVFLIRSNSCRGLEGARALLRPTRRRMAATGRMKVRMR